MHDIFLGRQAIYDRDLRVCAYELLFREGYEDRADIADGEQASSRVLVNTFMELGLDRVVGPHLAFINLTRGQLLNLPPVPLSKERVVFEVLEDTLVDDDLVCALGRLGSQGYTLALDDFLFESKWQPLLPHVHIVKVDVSDLERDGLEQRVLKLKEQKVQLLAEKVESADDFRAFHGMGFDFFQGYYFSRPHVISGRRLSPQHLDLLQLLARIYDPQTSPMQLLALVGARETVSVRVLGCMRTHAANLGYRLTALDQAAAHLGGDRLRICATMAVLGEVGVEPQELLSTGLLRARICELLSRSSGKGQPASCFAAGLFSILSDMMEVPMDRVMREIRPGIEVEDALLRREGAAGTALECALALEECRWDDMHFPGLARGDINELYLQSLTWAMDQVAASGMS